MNADVGAVILIEWVTHKVLDDTAGVHLATIRIMKRQLLLLTQLVTAGSCEAARDLLLRLSS